MVVLTNHMSQFLFILTDFSNKTSRCTFRGILGIDHFKFCQNPRNKFLSLFKIGIQWECILNRGCKHKSGVICLFHLTVPPLATTLRKMATQSVRMGTQRQYTNDVGLIFLYPNNRWINTNFIPSNCSTECRKTRISPNIAPTPPTF
jgi:hypothetical protein